MNSVATILVETATQGPATTPTGARSAVIVSCADIRPICDALGAGSAPAALPEELEARIASLCARGRAAGLRVEEIVVQLKRAWRELPGTARFEARSHRDTRLDRLVTALIEHYFDSRTPDRADAAEGGDRVAREIVDDDGSR